MCPLSELNLFSNCEIRYSSVFSCFPGRANYKHCDRPKMLLLLKQKRKWHKNRNKNSSERERQRNPPFRSWLLWRARASRSWKHFNEAAINTEVYSFSCEKSPKFSMNLDQTMHQFRCPKSLNLDFHRKTTVISEEEEAVPIKLVHFWQFSSRGQPPTLRPPPQISAFRCQ